MGALEKFVTWMASYTFVDRKGLLQPGLALNYHPRSDIHSKQLARFVVEDLLDTCEPLLDHALAGRVAFGINYRHTWPNGKAKTLDLVIGLTDTIPPPAGRRIREVMSPPKEPDASRPPSLKRVLISCEAKAVMTEHNKSEPRVYSELNDSHVIVHGGDRYAVASAITTVNISSTFISPLRQRPSEPVHVTRHNQPEATASMVAHLDQLPQRNSPNGVGLDAYCTFVLDADNEGQVALYEDPPAPQPADSTHYRTFLDRICHAYTQQFSDLDNAPRIAGLTIEEQLLKLADEYPDLMEETGRLIVAHGLQGAEELQAILQSINLRANPQPLTEDL